MSGTSFSSQNDPDESLQHSVQPKLLLRVQALSAKQVQAGLNRLMPLTTDWLAAIPKFILAYLLLPHLTQRSLNKSMTKACLTAALLDCPFSVMPNAYVWIKRSS